MLREMKTKDILLALAVACVLVLGIDLITNSLDTLKFTWDFKYYIGITEHGFNAKPLISPFAYRYPTPFLAAGFIAVLHVTIEQAYRMIAYMGGILQLFSVFLIVYHFFKSTKAAFLAMLVVAFSLMNLKFLLFDVYRPDHLAYAFVTLGLYFALTQRFYLLLITSCIAVQFREFGILPLFSYFLYLLYTKQWKVILRYTIPTAAALFVAIVLPRMLIPITDTIQFVNSDSGTKHNRLLRYLLSPKRNLNFIFNIVAYFLPLLMVITKERWKKIKSEMPEGFVPLLFCYTAFVTFLSFIGGGDLGRFVTYYFITQALLIGALYKHLSTAEIIAMLIATLVFNKIFLEIPMTDIDHYLDFYSGFSTRVNAVTFYRFGEIALWMAVGQLVRKYAPTKPAIG